MTIELVPSHFRRGDRTTDFVWMIEQPAWADALFVFNDNEHEWAEHRRPGHTLGSCRAGGGNAGIRPLQCLAVPRAIGIPTGDRSGGTGYGSLTPRVRGVIDEALAAVGEALAVGSYRRLVYSANEHGRLTTKIFVAGDDVIDHITAGLRALSAP